MIERLKTSELINILGYFPVLGIIGPRQVGKTTLTKVISKSLKKETLYIDLENPEDIAKLTDPVLFIQNNQEKCIILDEIQRSPNLFPILRSMVDQNRVPGRFIILGSASPDLIRDASESLAGRIAYEELSPFNILEVNTTSKYTKHWTSGGYPDAFLAPNSSMKKKWHFNFIQTYVERDLPLLGLKISGVLIRKLWTMLAHMNGNVINYSNLAKSLEMSSPSIKRYIDFMEEAFLIRQLQPYAVNIKKRLVKSPKVYVRDSGILHYLVGINSYDELISHPQLGNSWEGYVIEQICQLLREEYEPYFYRTHEGAECDLVITKNGVPTYGIEVKYTSSPKISKGLKQSFSDLKTVKNFIITPESDDYMIQENIRVCNLETFLKKYL